MRLRRLLIPGAFTAVLLAGCGAKESIGPPNASLTPSSPLGTADPPVARESIATATDRVAAALASPGCVRVLALRPLSRQSVSSPFQCQSFRALAGLEVEKAASYGGGAVADYVTADGQALSAVFILDADGLYHLAFIDLNPSGSSDPAVGTRFEPKFDAAAQVAVNALREKDCRSFQTVASERFLGTAETSAICAYASMNNPLANLSSSSPRAQPQRLGGNSRYAFYGVRAQGAYVTVVMARAPDSASSDPALGYVYADAFQTNTGTVGLAKPKESIAELQERVASSGDCEEAHWLKPLSLRTGLGILGQCRGVQLLSGLDVVKAATYRGGAVIDYAGDDKRRPSAAFVLDADGLYHFAMVDGYSTGSSVDTPFARQFDAAATATVNALRDRNCEAFRAVASVRIGPGAFSDRVCGYITRNLLSAQLQTYPESQPKRLGGNGRYAFYGLATPRAHFTLFFARFGSNAPPGTPPLPKNAPEYGYVDAYLTGTSTLASPAPGG
jgi:hypothetical protein